MKAVSSIEITLDTVHEGLKLVIDARKKDTLFDGENSSYAENEAQYQLLEGSFYDFEFNHENYRFYELDGNIIQPHARKKHIGIISPNIYVGTLSIPIIETETGKQVTTVELEIQSIKASYREDYRDMLEFITEKCTDLLLQANSPVSHTFEIDYTKDSQTLYQRFAFIRSVFGTDEFAEAVHRIVTAPVTKWSEISELSDVRKVKRFTNANIKELLKGSNQIPLPTSHSLRYFGFKTIPEKIATSRKTDSVDTPENRFIKHTLETFLKFCSDINKRALEFGQKQLANESLILVRELEGQLNHTVFKHISRPNTLKLNSPVLQRKEGYREVLRVWLMFDLAAKLIWKGGDDIYQGGKKDIATLYEYWLFFKLLEVFQEIFEVDPKGLSELIKQTPDGLSLQIRQGKFTALKGVFKHKTRKLNVKFNYNRSFSGKSEYPNPGSWTTTLRPDYTLSIWPFGITEMEAEKQELIVHIHFDAKYKVANLSDLIELNSEDELSEEKIENRKGIYKNADLLKMHAYKDAIRRTGGAYVLYPGDKGLKQKGFHEIIPGLGAFPVRPSKNESGIGELRAFVLEVIDHFITRTTQRERMAYRAYDIYKEIPNPEDGVKELLPEPYNDNRGLLPSETYVLVGFYNTLEQHEWIKKSKLYNFRMGSGSGSLELDIATVSSKYLLLHSHGDSYATELWRIVSKGPKVYSKEDLIKKGYPNPSQDNYLVIKLEMVEDEELQNKKWNFKELQNYASSRQSAVPFTTTLSELAKNTHKEP